MKGPELAVDYTERMNCPNLARALIVLWDAEHEYQFDEALWYLDREIELRTQWTRPLRFDIASGRPIGHLPEDEQMFTDYLDSCDLSSQTEKDRVTSLYYVWCADMTNTESQVLNLAREVIAGIIKGERDA